MMPLEPRDATIGTHRVEEEEVRDPRHEVQADVSLSLQDAVSGDTVAGPFTCAAMMFTDVTPEHDCGPFDLDAPHGRRYVVIQSWQYTGRSMLPGGTTKGPEFTW